MEEKKPISNIVAGLLIVGVLILFSVAMTFIGDAASSPGGGLLTYVIIIGGLILFINLYGKAKDHQVSFGDLFVYGFKTTAVITVIFVLFMIVLSFVFPEMKEKALEATREQMENQQGASDSQIESSLNLIEKYFWVFAIGGTLLGFLIVGAIGSLIGAAVTKKRPKNPFDTPTSY